MLLLKILYLALPIWYINIHVPHPTLVTLEGGNLGNFGLPQLFCDGKKKVTFLKCGPIGW